MRLPVLARLGLTAAFLCLGLCGLAPSPAHAVEAVLTLTTDGGSRTFTLSDLVNHPQAQTVNVSRDPSYGNGQTSYRAVPAAALFAGLPPPQGQDAILQAVALDGFVAQLPAPAVLSTDPKAPRAFVAVEDPAKPWPALPGKTYTAGPFYLVWSGPGADGVRSEQWPYQLASLSAQDRPEVRWPQIAVDAALPADAPARRGQAVFLVQCFTCHTINGGGDSNVGPDLNIPMNPTRYFQPAALKALLRDTTAVRTWPNQQMPAFPPDQLSDADIAAVIAYLDHMANRKPANGAK